MTVAPDLPGYDFEANLGQGGFADVYLYRQHRPERQVAVKVLRQVTRSEADAQRFENEINRMSKLSTHPGIVTIYEVGVTPDQRPYFTMEYCPNEHFGQIARAGSVSVAQALEVGIKVAGAVDTAHAAGILHRDIKPANILLTTYGEPALTDFGIAGGRDADATDEAEGVTIPFGPPEVVSGRSGGDELADVYSLGATTYSLLAGRAPFSTGRPASQAELIARITAGGPPPIGRQDVPDALDRVLATAMAVDPAHRYPSAAAFGRALQEIETSLNLPQTPLRVAPTTRPARRSAVDEDEDSTRFRAPARVDPEQIPSRSAPSSSASTAPITGISTPAGTPIPAPAPLPIPEALDAPTEHRDRPAPAAPVVYDEPDATGTSRVGLVASLIGAMVLVAIVLAVVVFGGGDDEAPPTTTPEPDEDAFVIVAPPVSPTDVEVRVADGGVGASVVWTVTGGEEDDRYRVEVTDGPLEGESFDTTEHEYRFTDDVDTLCVRVYAIRGSTVSDPSSPACLS